MPFIGTKISTDTLRKKIKGQCTKLEDMIVLQASVFGSSIMIDNPNDIDLLLVYQKGSVDPRRTPQLRHDIVSSLQDLDLPTINLLIMSDTEYSQSRIRRTVSASSLTLF